eukprot:TRINITY_DN8832_c0_g1_i1.p1 TRINITY_DN8832_c0_g1~~TRINITY_DN8832_c0_g1_i1.p1  ORF type:complete len:284 (-),score=52.11 TRINITY_DN8832_c0_g1_i1:24-782(-)
MDERVIQSYSCSLCDSNNALLPGRVYLTQKHLTFHSNFGGASIKNKFPWDEIESITGRTDNVTSTSFIEFVHKQQKSVFCSFPDPSRCFREMQELHRSTKEPKGSNVVKSIETGNEGSRSSETLRGGEKEKRLEWLSDLFLKEGADIISFIQNEMNELKKELNAAKTKNIEHQEDILELKEQKFKIERELIQVKTLNVQMAKEILDLKEQKTMLEEELLIMEENLNSFETGQQTTTTPATPTTTPAPTTTTT